MSWHRAAIIAACGFLLQCTSSINTTSQQSYNEALRRRVTTAPWCPPRQPSPCVVVPYPYFQTNYLNPRARSGANNIITQNIAAGWPEYRIKLPLCMGRPIKTNIIIELPLCMFPRPEPTGATNDVVSSSSSSSSSSPNSSSSSSSASSDAQSSSQNVPDDKSSALPPENVSKQEDLCELHPDEIIENEPSVPKEGDGSKDNNSESPVDNSSSTDQSETPCGNDSPSPSTNYIENNPTASEPANEANPEETIECSAAIPNEPIEIASDSAALDSACIDNTSKPIPESVSLYDSELVSSNEPATDNNEKTLDVTQNNGAIKPQPQTGDGGEKEECCIVDDTGTTDGTGGDIITEELLGPDDETTIIEDTTECTTPRTDDGTEIASSAGSEATPTD